MPIRMLHKALVFGSMTQSSKQNASGEEECNMENQTPVLLLDTEDPAWHSRNQKCVHKNPENYG